MLNPKAIRDMVRQAQTGDVEPSSPQELAAADQALAFSFGVRFGADGNIADPGNTNRSLAEKILEDPLLNGMPLTAQEEIALALEQVAPNHSLDIDVIESLKALGVCKNTREITLEAKDGSLRDVGKLAVVAFRPHLARAAAVVRKAGFDVAVPDMRDVGDFDPESSQLWTRDWESWVKKERIVIGHHALLGWI